MIRAPLRAVALLAVAGGLAVSGCGSADSNAAAATVGDEQVSRDEFEALLAAFATQPELGVTVDTVTETVAGDPARNLLGVMVRASASEQFLAVSGVEITAADREAVLEGVPADDPVLALPDDVVSVFVDLQAAAAARGRIAAPDAAELERRYAESPATLGAVCAYHVISASEGEAEAVRAEIAAGADVSEIAVERSIDPAAADSGGTLGGECVPLAALAEAGPDLLAAIEASAIGVPTPPAETSLGWHVVVRRPYDEVAEPLAALFADQAGDLMFDSFLATTDISVDPRYGRWDRLTSAVVAL